MAVVNQFTEVLVCQECDLRIRNTDWGRDEMQTHQAECDGINDPRERFDVGDRVRYSEFGKQRLDKEDREGEVVGFSELDHCVRVRWDGRKTPERYAHRFITHV